MNTPKKQVAVAVQGIVRFNNAKTMHAVAMTKRQDTLFEMGQRLGDVTGAFDAEWTPAIKAMRSKEDRAIVRAGFVCQRMFHDGHVYDVPHVNGEKKRRESAKAAACRKAAENRFDYLAKRHAAGITSRKAKHNARKETRGRKVKFTADQSSDAPNDGALRLQVVNWCAAMMKKWQGETDVLEDVGELRAIIDAANKASKASKAKASKASKASKVSK